VDPLTCAAVSVDGGVVEGCIASDSDIVQAKESRKAGVAALVLLLHGRCLLTRVPCADKGKRYKTPSFVPSFFNSSSQLTSTHHVDQLGLQKVQGEETGEGGEACRSCCQGECSAYARAGDSATPDLV